MPYLSVHRQFVKFKNYRLPHFSAFLRKRITPLNSQCFQRRTTSTKFFWANFSPQK